MLKSVQLKLSKIKYNGDSIGGDIRVEIEALSKFLRVDKRIKVGTTAEINRDVGIFETDHPNTPWKKGIYDIEIPSSPHQVSPDYLHKAKLAKAWFLVGHAGERFLHTGTRSLGCMTIIELEIWDKLCETLLKSRKGDFMSVGMVEVID